MELSEGGLAGFFAVLMPHLDERQRRVLCGAMAQALGHGGQARVVAASGISTSTMSRAAREAREGFEVTGRQRAVGAGDKRAVDKQPGLSEALDALVAPGTRGDPESVLRWTLKSTYELADELRSQGFAVSAELVRRLLHEMGFSLQAPEKQVEGAQSPDRDAQFRYLNGEVEAMLDAGEPVISVDTKKKELIGNYQNKGREWRPAGEPEQVKVHDFPDPDLAGRAKAVPYGVYDLAGNEGWVSVGDSADTSEFAVGAVSTWWDQLGRHRYPDATELLITADAGGSNGYRRRAWKWHLQQFADETGLDITVAHYPPGTSKWNRIEHRLFSFISMNWRGRPLTSIRTIVELISATTNKGGLTVQAAHDAGTYQKGIKITDDEMQSINLEKHTWHGDWNYTIKPTPNPAT